MSGQSTNLTSGDGGDELLSDRELIVFRAIICEEASRFDDMVDVMKEMCQSYDDLSENERNLLSCAYKNVIGSRRTSWRILNEAAASSSSESESSQSISSKDGDKSLVGGGKQNFSPVLIRTLLSTIENEIKVHCKDIIEILTTRLIPSLSTTGESRVFYYKMKGDYTRYLCETCTGLDRKEKANESLLAYKIASDRATIELPPTHPVRLGLMLNFSVFYYEIMKSPDRSCRLAKQAFDDAIAELDTLSEERYRDSTIIMQLLRDNLNLWRSEQNLQPSNDLIQQQKQQQQ